MLPPTYVAPLCCAVRALEQGLLLVGEGEHTIRLPPPLVITAEALTEREAKLERAIG